MVPVVVFVVVDFVGFAIVDIVVILFHFFLLFLASFYIYGFGISANPLNSFLEMRVRWDSDPRHFNPVKH